MIYTNMWFIVQAVACREQLAGWWPVKKSPYRGRHLKIVTERHLWVEWWQHPIKTFHSISPCASTSLCAPLSTRLHAEQKRWKKKLGEGGAFSVFFKYGSNFLSYNILIHFFVHFINLWFIENFKQYLIIFDDSNN